MNYDEALEYMNSLNKRGIHPGLDGISMLSGALGNPERGMNYIHVVGTNGKGSTSLMISSILKAAGYRVGIYSSPAVFSEREIIKVGGREISKNEYASLVESISSKNTFSCTRFEVETIMAFMYFKAKECDFVVLEAGMGGELDATNITDSALACVFTSIGMDHSGFLGDTVEKIAAQKAGIIKENALALSTLQDESVNDVILQKAKENNAEYVLSDYRQAVSIKYKLTGTTFSYGKIKDIHLNLLGSYQIKNACLAIDIALALNTRGVKITEKQIVKGLENAKYEGRFEKICDKPLFFIDGAHNEPASLMLRNTLETYFTKKKFIYIMGMLRDKDCVTVVKNTVDLADCVFTVATANKERTLSSFELAEIVRDYNPMVTSLDSIDEAVEMALMMADKDTVIVGFGSLSHLNDIKKAVENRKSIKKDTHGVL